MCQVVARVSMGCQDVSARPDSVQVSGTDRSSELLVAVAPRYRN